MMALNEFEDVQIILGRARQICTENYKFEKDPSDVDNSTLVGKHSSGLVDLTLKVD
jgi:hypothetical protein